MHWPSSQSPSQWAHARECMSAVRAHWNDLHPLSSPPATLDIILILYCATAGRFDQWKRCFPALENPNAYDNVKIVRVLAPARLLFPPPPFDAASAASQGPNPLKEVRAVERHNCHCCTSPPTRQHTWVRILPTHVVSKYSGVNLRCDCAYDLTSIGVRRLFQGYREMMPFFFLQCKYDCIVCGVRHW